MGSRIHPGALQLQSNLQASQHPSNMALSHHPSLMQNSQANAVSQSRHQPQEAMAFQTQMANQSQVHSQIKASTAPRNELYQSAMNLAEQHEVEIPEENLPNRLIPGHTTIVKKPHTFGIQGQPSLSNCQVMGPLSSNVVQQEKLKQPSLRPADFSSFEDYLIECEKERTQLRQTMDRLKAELHRVSSDTHINMDQLSSSVAILNKAISDVGTKLNQNEVASFAQQEARVYVVRKESIQNGVVSKIKSKFGASEAKVGSSYP